jgi:hypothetical protein
MSTEPRDVVADFRPTSLDLEPEHLTDLGNARRLVAAHRQDLQYEHAWGSWLVWDGARWSRDETGGGLFRVWCG